MNRSYERYAVYAPHGMMIYAAKNEQHVRKFLAITRGPEFRVEKIQKAKRDDLDLFSSRGGEIYEIPSGYA